MENGYFNKVKNVLTHARPRLAATHRLEFKNCFGAVAGYVNGHIFISCGKFGVALKLPPQILEHLFNKKIAKRLKYFPRGHIKKEYAVLQKRITQNTKQFSKLVDQSVQYVLK